MFDRQLFLRTVTGLTIGAIVIFTTLNTSVGTMILILAFTGRSAFEFFRMQQVGTGRFMILPLLLCVLPIVVTGLMLQEWMEGQLRPVILLSMVGAFGMLVFVSQLRAPIEKIQPRLMTFGLSVILFTVPGICALYLTEETPVLILGIFVMQWGGDVFAYFGGRLFGRVKLAPGISPNKTREGFFAGFLATALAAWILSVIIPEIQLHQWCVMAVLVVVFGTAGDLLQSAIKRAAGVKDSGGFLPGHGGVWDRFDSFLGCVSWIALYYFLI